MEKSEIVRKFESMGVDDIPVTIEVKDKEDGRERRANKIVKMHDKNYKESKGKSYDEMPIPIIYTEKAEGEGIYRVYGESSKTWYKVLQSDNKWECECYDFRYRLGTPRNQDCKHVMAIKLCSEMNLPMMDKEFIMSKMENIEQ